MFVYHNDAGHIGGFDRKKSEHNNDYYDDSDDLMGEKVGWLLSVYARWLFL